MYVILGKTSTNCKHPHFMRILDRIISFHSRNEIQKGKLFRTCLFHLDPFIFSGENKQYTIMKSFVFV